ncbi:hypothetical protein [Microbulbifer hainanensis]|uniref:hypothetical protein n=1 Tax=Microbulbifer hainanensis TaxID=2735675 RepID=UPI0018693FFA|nr:hypothetical protein [Microbulbifer hainanensis]
MRKLASFIFSLTISAVVFAKDAVVQPEGSNWKITKLNEWKLQADDDLWSFYKDDGAGALQISVYKFTEKISEQQFKEIAVDNNPSNAILSKFPIQSLPALTSEYVDSGVYWKVWYIAVENEFLLITYNCDLEYKGLEEKSIQAMVRSVRKA